MKSPREVDETFVKAMNDGDFETAFSVWNEDTVFVLEPGQPEVRGTDNLRAALGEFFKVKPKLKVERLHCIEAGDVALQAVRWHLTGVDAEGAPLEMEHIDCNVLRRQADGTWRVVIDNPFHSLHIGVEPLR
jgi:uncharacterized protein (TIGR02246 family)